MKNLFYSKTFLSLILIISIVQICNAQIQGPSFSASYDFYPYSNLKEPDPGTFQDELQIRVATIKIKAAYPNLVSQRTFLMHEILYDRFDMDYVNWDEIQGGREIPHGHAVKYNLMIMHTFSDKWSLLAFITPGLASDFAAKLSKDDFTIETAIVFIYKFSPKFSLGAGLAYSRQLGEPLPLPVLALDWNNGTNMRARAILPANLEVWYMMSPRFELGLVLNGDGNEYHGDPGRYGGDNPKMKYSVFTMGPSLKYRLNESWSILIDGGYTFQRRFEFTNEFGSTEVEEILDLENAAYVRIGFQLGG